MLQRRLIASQLGWLGAHFDESLNNFRGEEKAITTPDSKVQIWVIPTNEELMIAKDTYELVK
jgi:acetate kinase